MKPVLDVRLLGPFSLHLDGNPVDTAGWQRRPAMLIRLLAASRENRRTRDEAIDLFWPDSDSSAGATNLRYVLHLLRRYLAPAPAPVISQAGWLSLSPEYVWSIDLARFDSLTHAADRVEALRQAAGLFTGEPLVEDRYEDWAAAIRDVIAHSWRSLARSAAQEARDRGDVQAEADAYEQLLRHDPLDEEAMQGLLQALARLGRRSEALERYSSFEKRYTRELDAPPGDELAAQVQRLYARFSRGNVSPPLEEFRDIIPRYPLPTGGSVVGRSVERRQILDVLPRAGSAGEGSPRLIAVQGEAGMGKTWLLGDVARAAREAGVVLLAGGCYELEGRLPYGPLHDALTDYVLAAPGSLLAEQLIEIGSDIASILPDVRGRIPSSAAVQSTDPEARRLRLFAAISTFLSRISAWRPTVLILDDLHWADEETISLLHFLLRQSDLGRLLILTAFRAEEMAARPAVRALVQPDTYKNAAVQLISLAPLSQADLADLLSERLHGECTDSLIEVVNRRSAANPFFALQIVRLLQKEDRLRLAEGGWQIDANDSIDLPVAVRDVIGRRLHQFSSGERTVLAEASVLGREFGIAPLSAFTQASESEMWNALDRAVEAFILAETDEGYAFRHPLLHEVVHAGIPIHRRASLHARAGLALERLYGPDVVRHASELAHHFVRSGDSHAVRTRAYSVLAGDEAAQSFAHSTAEQHFRTALLARDSTEGLRLIEPLPDALPAIVRDDTAILVKLGRTLTSMGKNGEALEALHSALARLHQAGDVEGAAGVVVLMGNVHLRLGSKTEGISLVDSAIAEWGQRPVAPDLVRLHLTRSLLVYWAMPGGSQGRGAALETLRLADDLGDPTLRAEAWVGLAREEMRERQWAAAYRMLEPAVPLLEAAGAYDTLREALTMLFQIDWLQARYGTTSRWIEKGVEVAQRIGDPYMKADFLAALARHHVYTGKWDLTIQYGEAAVDAVERTDGAQYKGFALGLAPTIRALRGNRSARFEMEAACAACEEVQEMTSVSYVQSWIAKLEMLDGDPEAAASRLEGVRDRTRGPDPGMATATLGAAYVQMGQLDRAAQMIERAVIAAAGKQLEEIEVLRARALLADRQSEREEARAWIESALERARAMPFALAEARFLTDLAAIQAGAGVLEDALSSLDVAEAIFVRLEAKPFLDHARKLRRGVEERARAASSPG